MADIYECNIDIMLCIGTLLVLCIPTCFACTSHKTRNQLQKNKLEIAVYLPRYRQLFLKGIRNNASLLVSSSFHLTLVSASLVKCGLVVSQITFRRPCTAIYFFLLYIH